MKNLIICLLLLLFFQAHSQNPINYESNPIQFVVPILKQAMDAKAMGTGHTGVATFPDVNSNFWNPAKFAFINDSINPFKGGAFGLSFSYFDGFYEHWDKSILSQFSIYKSFSEQTVSGSFRYVKLGEIIFTAEDGSILDVGKPTDLYFDVAYSRKLCKSLSGALSVRYIYSDLDYGSYVTGYQPASSIAMDLAFFYTKKIPSKVLDNSLLNLGLNISNIGSKISYSKNDEYKDFIPTNLRLGTSYFWQKDLNSFTFSVDVNKLLVPSSPTYLIGSDGLPVYVGDNPKIDKGMDPNVSVLRGMFQSFYDAPRGFEEEIEEIYYGLGFEWWYDNLIAIRTGYYHEHDNKGVLKYFAMGVGTKYKNFGLDFTYLLNQNNNNFLKNTWYLTILYQMDTK